MGVKKREEKKVSLMFQFGGRLSHRRSFLFIARTNNQHLPGLVLDAYPKVVSSK
jgi:hypothetical protein